MISICEYLCIYQEKIFSGELDKAEHVNKTTEQKGKGVYFHLSYITKNEIHIGTIFSNLTSLLLSDFFH